MLNENTVAVVIPALNEETQIGMVIETMPGFVDRIVVVNDGSTDKTADVVKHYWKTQHNEGIEIKSIVTRKIEGRYEAANRVLQEEMVNEVRYFPQSRIENLEDEKDRIILISLKKNTGVGAAVARGYKWCKDHAIDCTAVMGGDGQMDPDELESICRPVIDEGIDYVKGNRLIHRSANRIIPKVRFIGNSVLSILTKLASGYWHVSDTQCGFTAISNKALNAIRLYKIYRRYGMPNDILVKLNIALCTIKEVETKPVYNIGEKSKMKIGQVICRVSWLLVRSFFKRIWTRYFFRDFHPLFILYNMAFFLILLSIPFALTILNYLLDSHSGGDRPILNSIMFMFLFVSALQSLLFAMWMDIQDNERFYK